jgi:hypothetical protein
MINKDCNAINNYKNNYNPEIALAILCCRQYLQTADNNSIQVFIQENKIDWKQFYRLCAAHRIRPVVYKVLDSLKDFIKPENLLELRNYCIYSNAFALNNKRELNRILDLLKQNNILAKAFKGLDFAENIYGNIGLREFSDNDIIILDSDIRKAIPIMINEGYHSKDVEFYQKFPKQYIRDYKDFLFEKGDGAVRDFAFEFHFKSSRYFQGYPFTFEDLLGQHFMTELKSYTTDHYLKLITLSNGLMDYYPNLRSVLDIAVIFKKQNSLEKYDPVLNEFIEYGRLLSFSLFNYPEISIEQTKQEKIKFCDKLLKNILELKAGKRISLLKYMYYRIKNVDSIKYKAAQLKNYFLLFIRPNYDDVAALKLRYYSLYYFTKPFRIVIKIFQGRFK